MRMRQSAGVGDTGGHRPLLKGPAPMGRLAQTEGLTDIQQEILATVRTFVDKEILPYATELEHKDEFPRGDRRGHEGDGPVRPDDP